MARFLSPGLGGHCRVGVSEGLEGPLREAGRDSVR